ncbi:metabotropic glutamate receptor 6 [Trichonephila clavipes]|uniref:Metabotropic glutamate receptor 6 n=1 Tax=Trichonephila clavipes TaxID=2585209 RepID=A0A8X6SVC0_TRICX|nr:metabotropic glutamate receptor 6 [Trichonephila clavipes]
MSSSTFTWHVSLTKVFLQSAAAVIVGSQAEIDGINVKISFGITNSLSIAIHDRIKYIVKFITPPVAGFEDYFKYLNVKNNKRNPWFAEYWEQTFSCKLPETKQTPWNKFDKVCNGNEKLSTVDRLQIEETIKHASDSVMAFAYAIKAMHSDLCDDEPGVCDAMKPLNRTMLLKNLKNVSFKVSCNKYIPNNLYFITLHLCLQILKDGSIAFQLYPQHQA